MFECSKCNPHHNTEPPWEHPPHHPHLTHWPTGRFEQIFRQVIFQLISVTDGWGISCKIALRWMPLDLTDDKSTLVQVMAWCHQATSHYPSQCWPRSMSPNGVTRPQWVNYHKVTDMLRLHCSQSLKCFFWFRLSGASYRGWVVQVIVAEWGIYVWLNWVINGSGNGLSPVWHWAIL